MTSASLTKTKTLQRPADSIRRHAGILTLLILFLTIKLFFITKSTLIGWDESVYLGMGKYLYSAGTSGLWEDIRPPLLPLLFGLGWKTGFNTILFSQTVILLFSMATLLLLYFLTLEFTPSRTTALAASTLLATTPIFFGHSSLLLTGIPAAFFILLALLLHIRGHNPWLVGSTCALAFLARFPAAILLLPLAVDILTRSPPSKDDLYIHKTIALRLSELLKLSTGFITATLPFLLFNYLRYHHETQNWLDAAFRPINHGSLHQGNPFHSLSGALTNLIFYPSKLLNQQPLLLASLLGLTYLCFSRTSHFNKKKNFLLLSSLLIFGAYFTWIPNKQTRFALLFLPLITLAAAIAIEKIFTSLPATARWRYLAASACFILIGALSIPAINQDLQTYNWLPQEPHPLQAFYSLPLEGLVITTIPMPAAYNDNLFIPLYDNPSIALSTYASWKNDTQTIIYFSGFYPCTDNPCQEQKDLLHTLISTHQLTHIHTHNNEEYAILTTATS